MSSQWEWTPQREDCAVLVFENLLMRQQIADEIGISMDTLKRWLRQPEFQARVDELRKEYSEYLLRSGIPFVRLESRVEALSAMAAEAKREFDERRYCVEMRPVPGGMLTNEHFNIDAANLFRNCLADIAKETGGRSTKVDLNARVEHTTIQVNTVELSAELAAKYLRAGDTIVDAEADDEVDDADDEDDGETAASSPTPLFNIHARE